MKYGYFNETTNEYVINQPNTPRPWINYLTNENYCAITSHTGGGYSFYKDCRIHRINRWAPENWHFDRPGRYIYVKDVTKKKAGKNDIWSMTYQPVRKKPSFFEARHGLGYTTIKQKINQIEQKVSYFVPTDDTCELWIVEIKNLSKATRKLEVYPYIEWLIGDYHEELRYRNIMNLYNRVWYEKSKKCIFAKKTALWKNMGIQEFPFNLFMFSSLPVNGYAVRKDHFLGRYNTEEDPQMLHGEFKNNDLSSGEDSIALLRHTLTLKPNECKSFVVCVGQAKEGRETSRILKKYKSVQAAKKALNKTKDFWRHKICENIVVNTPDKKVNQLINTWNKYQLYICNLWSRSPSFYHEGAGGRGYRDSSQDAESICSINSELTRQKILKIASLIRKDGTSAPGWNDIAGPAGHRPNKDHQIWLTMTVSAYLKETGNKKILFSKIPYLKDKWLDGWHIDHKHKKGASIDGHGTLAEHLEKNLNYCYGNTGRHGLPLIGHADWNDAIDSAGIKLKGESVWLAMALVRSLKTYADMMAIVGNKKKTNDFNRKAENMTKRINKCWDGAWYQRGITDDGTIYGSRKNKEGKIYLNSQSWAILAGVADKKKTSDIIKSVEKLLNGKHGLALFYPAYSSFDKKLGRISMFSEGTKENAAVFCHAALFYITAMLQAGKGNLAMKYLKQIMPNYQGDYDLYKTEPYAYAEYLVGPEHPYLYGEGAFTWVTGTAGWSFMAVTEHMLGIKREFKGLKIDPCIPKIWKRFSVTRPFRGTTYEIEVKNPNGVEKGVKKIFVDGKSINGDIIFPTGRKKSKVSVVMGKRN